MQFIEVVNVVNIPQEQMCNILTEEMDTKYCSKDASGKPYNFATFSRESGKN